MRGPVHWKRAAVIMAVAAALLATLAMTARPAGGREVSLHWTYDYSKDPACPVKPDKMCVVGFHVFVENHGRRDTQVFVGNRFDAKRQVIGSDLAATLRVEKFGTFKFCVAALARTAGGKGAEVESEPICHSRAILPFGIGKDQDLR